MKLKAWMMIILLTLPAGMCVTKVTNDTSCDTFDLLMINDERVVQYLLKSDRELLEGIVIHNQTWEKFCSQSQ